MLPIERWSRGLALAAQVGGFVLIVALVAGFDSPGMLKSTLAGLLVVRGLAGAGHGWAWCQRNPERGRRVFGARPAAGAPNPP